MMKIAELEELEKEKKLKQYMNPGRSKYIRQIDGPKVYPRYCLNFWNSGRKKMWKRRNNA